MKKSIPSLALLLAWSGAPALSVPALSQPSFQVVVNVANPIVSTTRGDLSRIFLGKTDSWSDGTPVSPIDHRPGRLRDDFSLAVHGRRTDQILGYWQREVFSRRSPPPQAANDLQALDHVRSHRGGIGYVAAGTYLGRDVRPLPVTDLEEDPLPSPDDSVVSSHGEVELILTGSCGKAGGEGHRAVLQNRHPYQAIEVSVEISTWAGGLPRSTQVKRFSVNALGEKEIGCTAPTGSGERRFLIREVSDASRPATTPHHRAPRPARDFIALVEAGTCGRDRAGHDIVIANRHPYLAIRVAISQRSTVDGRPRSRKTDRFSLPPGKEKRLGCDRDGGLENEYRLEEVEYR